MIACLVTSNSKIKIQSSDSKNIKEITKVDLDEILASHSTEWVYIGRPLRWSCPLRLVMMMGYWLRMEQWYMVQMYSNTFFACVIYTDNIANLQSTWFFFVLLQYQYILFFYPSNPLWLLGLPDSKNQVLVQSP